ncbi:MAG: type II secretion system protein M [Candidatus Sedimenticola sp. (ex Thyasira tokunagai)]
MAWWASLAPRERLFLGWGAFIALMLGLYMGVAQPLEAEISQVETRLQASQKELSKLNEITAEYEKLGKSKKKIKAKNEGSLLAIIDKSSAQFALKQSIKRITPEGKAKVRIQLQDARFDKLIGWLNNLAKDRGIHTQTINLRKEEAPGRVAVTVVLKRG